MSGYVTEILMFAYYIIVHQQAKKQFPGLSPQWDTPNVSMKLCLGGCNSWTLL